MSAAMVQNNDMFKSDYITCSFVYCTDLSGTLSRLSMLARCSLLGVVYLAKVHAHHPESYCSVLYGCELQADLALQVHQRLSHICTATQNVERDVTPVAIANNDICRARNS